MPTEVLADREKWWHQFRRLIVPDWIWQLTWLRRLPSYHRMVNFRECTRSRWRVLLDMLYIFMMLRTIPEHYGPNRLWEVPRKKWLMYYSCPYAPIQRGRIARRVYPFEYEPLYNNKVLAAQLCRGLSVRQPSIFGTLRPDEQYRQRLVELLDAGGEDRVFLKPVFGRSGIGICIAERAGADVVVRASDGSLTPLARFTLELPVFVQELIRQDARMAAISSASVNTIRVVTLLTPSDEVLIAGCVLRSGVGNSFVDNWGTGGVAVGVETETGRLRKHGSDWTGSLYEKHPTSGFVFDGFQIPEWNRILEAARTVQRELPFSRIAGLDICLNHDATPTVIEINGLPDIGLLEQMNGPLLADPKALRFFGDYDLLVTRKQKRLLAS